MRNKHQIIEEPCEIKVSCTVLKTNGAGDSLVEFNGDTRYTERLSFLGDCPPVSDCDGAPLKLRHIVQIWLSRFVYRVGVYRVGGIVDGTLHNATPRFLSPKAQSLANCRDISLV
ncbi:MULTISPECIES: hypothetical protein [unclassified Microcoleus]|uniref:hypothetical protein n=1 Tax=unclassified Microcoleus TaxID=2642155 RepID=UPI002FD270B9